MVKSKAKTQLWIGVTRDVEARRVLENVRVPIGGAHEEKNERALGNGVTVEGHVTKNGARGQLHGRDHTQKFIDGNAIHTACPQRALGVVVTVESEKGSGNEIHRGLVSGDQEEDGGR